MPTSSKSASKSSKSGSKASSKPKSVRSRSATPRPKSKGSKSSKASKENRKPVTRRANKKAFDVPQGGKYAKRPSPPFSANSSEARGTTRRGNDGHMWTSKKASNGVYRWARV